MLSSLEENLPILGTLGARLAVTLHDIVRRYRGNVLLADIGITGQHFLVQSLVAIDAFEQLHSQ